MSLVTLHIFLTSINAKTKNEKYLKDLKLLLKMGDICYGFLYCLTMSETFVDEVLLLTSLQVDFVETCIVFKIPDFVETCIVFEIPACTFS